MIWAQSCDGDGLLSDIDETVITCVAQLSFPFSTRYLSNPAKHLQPIMHPVSHVLHASTISFARPDKAGDSESL